MALKFTVERDEFLAAMAVATKIVKTTETVPIVSCARLVVSGDRLRLSTSDLQMYLTTSVKVDVEVPGSIAADANGLARIAASCAPGSQIEFNAPQDNALTARSGRARFKLEALDPADFPNPASIEKAEPCAFPAQTLAFLLTACETAISTEETRHYLNGINFSVRPGKNGGGLLRVASTDGHRLTLAEVPVDQDLADAFTGLEARPILPRGTVRHLRQMLPEDGMVTFRVSDALMGFAFGELEIISKLIDGNFPDFDRVIPTGNDKTQTLNRSAFSALAGRIADFAPREGKRPVRALRLSFAKTKLEISAGPRVDILAADEIEISGPDALFEIGCNGRYLRDVLAISDSEDVVLAYQDAVAPMLFTFPGDPRLTAVLMPLRID